MDPELSLYELKDLLVSNRALFATQLTFYVSLISAYLVAAYLVGRKLTSLQIIVLTVIYSLTILGALASMMATLLDAYLLMLSMWDNYPEHAFPYKPSGNGLWIVGGIFFAGFIMSLVFMLNVRRLKTDV